MTVKDYTYNGILYMLLVLRNVEELSMRILSTGEVLWDLVEGTEFLGGAPLNFFMTSQRLGNSVSLLTGVGEPESGRKALRQMVSLGLNTNFVRIVREAPTGTAQVTLDKSGSATFQIGRPAAFDVFARGCLAAHPVPFRYS